MEFSGHRDLVGTHTAQPYAYREYTHLVDETLKLSVGCLHVDYSAVVVGSSDDSSLVK